MCRPSNFNFNFIKMGTEFHKSFKNHINYNNGTDKVDKNKIPLFDPYTGEPNKDYEKITGEPNPLLSSLEIEDFNNVPQYFEPKLKNRFLVVFPEELGIKPYLVSSIKLPSTEVKKNIFGHRKFIIEDFQIEMIDSISDPKLGLFHSLMKDGKSFDLVVEQLTPKNIVIEKIELKTCIIKRIDCQDMVYKPSDDLSYKYKLTITSLIMNIH